MPQFRGQSWAVHFALTQSGLILWNTAFSWHEWRRLYNAFAEDQNRSQIGTHIMQVVVKAMNPARYTTDPVLLRTRLDRLN